MKRLPIILMLTATVAAGAFLACNKNKAYPTTLTPAQATFADQTGGTYYIKNDPNSQFKIPVAISANSGVSRTVTVTVTSPTGATAAQYSIPSTTVTIPAGKVVDSLTVKGLFAGYSTGRIDTLVITINGGDAPASPYNNTYKLVLRKYCDVVLANLSGNYANSNDDDGSGQGPYGPYTVGLINLTSTGATTATGTLTNFDYEEWGPPISNITVNLDWTDPANFKATIPSQTVYADYKSGATDYGPVFLKSLTGSFSSCDNTFKFTYTLSVALGTFSGNFSTTMAR